MKSCLLFGWLMTALPVLLHAQLPGGATREGYATELRAIVQRAPLLPYVASSIPVSPPPGDWELGMVSWTAADESGLIYLFHRGEKVDPIVVVDGDGRVVRSWGAGLYETAHSIRLDLDGNVWTTDAKTSVVSKFSPDGRKLLDIAVGGVPEDCASAFCGTTDVAFGPSGGIFVADGYRNARIVEYSADGTKVREWGRAGTGPGEFRLPHSIVVDEDGIIYVADRENGRIQRFDPEGRFLGEWPYGKTFALELASGAVWLSSQHLHEPNMSPGWLIKVDRRTGEVLGYVPATGGHGIHAAANGELLTAPGPEQKPQRFRPPS